MSDEGHKRWVAGNRETYVDVLIPCAFLSALAKAAAPVAPTVLSSSFEKMSRRRTVGGCLRVSWPVASLPALAAYAEECSSTWSPRRIGVTARAAAEALAAHARRLAEQES